MQAWQHQIVAFQSAGASGLPGWIAAFLAARCRCPRVRDEPGPWRRVKWMPQGWPYIHPVQDVEASQKAAIRAGFTTRSAGRREQGEDAEAHRRRAGRRQRARRRARLKYDSDGRQAAASARRRRPTEDHGRIRRREQSA
jgi:capsid protein